MFKRLALPIVFIIILAIVTYAQDIVPWNKAQNHYGETVTIEGRIVSTYNSGKACFLNFHEDYKNHFTAVIFASDFEKFPNDPEDNYYNKLVRVSGLVKKYKGKPEIILKSPSQIKIVVDDKKESKPVVVSWEDAHDHYGEYATVKGTIIAAHNSGKACFLNFHKNWKRYFTAVIFASAFDKFPDRPEDYYINKKVEVTGLIKEYQGKPEIIVKSPKQIKVLN